MDESLKLKILVILLTSVGIWITIFALGGELFAELGDVFRRIFKKKWQKKLENLFGRYAKAIEKEGDCLLNPRISKVGDLVADVYRDVFGEKVLVSKGRILVQSESIEYGKAILEILDKVLGKTGCRTVEELEMWLEKGGF